MGTKLMVSVEVFDESATEVAVMVAVPAEATDEGAV
jgi:hypothetical protein